MPSGVKPPHEDTGCWFLLEVLALGLSLVLYLKTNVSNLIWPLKSKAIHTHTNIHNHRTAWVERELKDI